MVQIVTSYIYACADLECGDAGDISGNGCIQNTSLDSSCVDAMPLDYGWMDNTAFLSCECYYTYVRSIFHYTKKADGIDCTKDGNSGFCTAASV